MHSGLEILTGRCLTSPRNLLHYSSHLPCETNKRGNRIMGKPRNPRQPAATRSRRDFLKTGTAAVAGATALSMPQIARAQETISWKFQSTWPAKDIFHEYAQDYVNRVNEMAGGRLKLELLPANAVAKAFEMQDAVIAGTLDGGHGVCAYWYGKNKAFSLFGTPPAWGWRANHMLGWMKYGG